MVALVGPTGVGKTTTIAKLAANFRLRDKWNVGLITVDTYRIAAVEQLRTYADIIDSADAGRQHAARNARGRRSLVAPRSDPDRHGRPQPARTKSRFASCARCLAEARADEVHLVLSSVASAASLISTAERFAPAGATALILTKLDEASGLGHLLPWSVAHACR